MGASAASQQGLEDPQTFACGFDEDAFVAPPRSRKVLRASAKNSSLGTSTASRRRSPETSDSDNDPGSGSGPRGRAANAASPEKEHLGVGHQSSDQSKASQDHAGALGARHRAQSDEMDEQHQQSRNGVGGAAHPFSSKVSKSGLFQPKSVMNSALRFFGMKGVSGSDIPNAHEMASELFEFCLTICMGTAPEIMSFVEVLTLDDRKAMKRLIRAATKVELMGSDNGRWSFPAPVSELVGAFLQEVIEENASQRFNSKIGSAAPSSVPSSGDRAGGLGKSSSSLSLSAGFKVKRQVTFDNEKQEVDKDTRRMPLQQKAAGSKSNIDLGGMGHVLGRSPSDLGQVLGLKRAGSALSVTSEMLHLKRSGSAASDMSCTSFSDFNSRYMTNVSNGSGGEIAIARPSFLDFLHSLGQDVIGGPTGRFAEDGNDMTMDFNLPQDFGSAGNGRLDTVSEAGMSYHSAFDAVLGSDTQEKEIVQAQMVNINGAGPGQVRIAFKSKCLRTQNEWQQGLLKQQKVLIDMVSNKLKVAQQSLEAGDELRDEQKELLRGFRKIVARDVSEIDQNVTVYVIERDDTLRREVEELCTILEYPVQAFRGLTAAREAIKDDRTTPGVTHTVSTRTVATSNSIDTEDKATKCLLEGRPGQDCKDWRSRALMPQSSLKNKKGAGKKGNGKNSDVLPDENRTVSLVLLGSAWLEKDIPPEWHDDGVYVVLTSLAEEFEEVGKTLFASGEGEIRENLRKKGISQYLLHPLSMEAVRCVVTEAFRKRFADEYLLLQAVGRGTSGVVHRAKRLPDGGNFALKEINTKRLSKSAKQEVEKESQLLRELKWPTVVFLVDTWESPSDRLRYLLMPLLDGGNLQGQAEPKEDKDGVKPEKASSEMVAEWYAQTLHGLTYMHWRGVIHRDIKPSNLLLGADGRSLQIGDLGSATMLPGLGPHPMRRNIIKGTVCTPLYAAPEVLLQEFYSASTDLWALGATFYEILVQQTFFESGLKIDQLAEQAKAYEYRTGPWPDALAKVKSTLPPMLELPDMMQSDHLLRPSASELVGRSATYRRLHTNLGATGALPTPELRKAHFDEFARVRSESNKAADLIPRP